MANLAAPFSSRLPLLALAGLALSVATAATLLYRSALESARDRASAELAAVTSLQVDALTTWRHGRELDADHLARYPTVEIEARRAASGLPPEDPGHLTRTLTAFAHHAGLERALAVRGDGAPLFGWVRPGAPSVPVDLALVTRSMARDTLSSTLHAAAGEPEPRLDVAVPLHDELGRPVAALYVQAPMGRFLTGLTARWPVPGGSARIYLSRRDGDAVIFVANPRGDPLGGLSERVPIGSGIASVRAVVGPEGAFVAPGEQGEEVLGSTLTVPASDWRLWTRVPVREVERPIRRAALICLVALSLFVGTVVGGLSLWWRREAAQQAVLERIRRDLARSEERLTLALAGTHFVWEYDLVQERISFDPGCGEALGIPADQLTGPAATVLRCLVHPDDLLAVSAQLRDHLTGETPSFETQHRLAHAPDRWVLAQGRACGRDAMQRPLRMVGIVSEVTSLHAMRAELERSRRLASLGTLAAGVAHEVNNPLAYVLSSLDHLATELPLAMQGRLDLTEAVRDARDGAVRVRDVVRSLKAFSRPRPATPEPVDVADEVGAALRLAAVEIEHRARLMTELGPMPLVRAPPHELGQVFLNLMVNAAQAIPEGRRADHAVTVTTGTDAHGWAFVVVRDTGVGIPLEVQAHVFEPFFTTKDPGAGTGLGLALSRGIVVDAGGHIEVRSEPGRGSAFCVRLPPAARPVGHAGPPPPGLPPLARLGTGSALAPQRPAARDAGPRVLVVDDDPLVARSIVRSLGASCAVTTAASGAEALRAMDAAGTFDVVLCDLMMPEMSGMDLHAEVERRHPGLAERFVFLTGGAFTTRARDFLEAGERRALDKPFDPLVLRELVARTARGAQA